ncbi:MAG TPA: hypothetical protein VGF56_05740 [Rhizomicrobium sp.]
MNRLATPEGIAVWEVFRCAHSQMRIAITSATLPTGGTKLIRIATGLDFTAVIMLAQAMNCAGQLFLDLLPEVEALVVRDFNEICG